MKYATTPTTPDMRRRSRATRVERVALNVQMPVELVRAIKHHAIDADISLAHAVEQALRDFVGAKEPVAVAARRHTQERGTA